MSGRVQLDFHVLRRRRVAQPYGWGTPAPDRPWLDSQLQAYIERHSAESLADKLLEPGQPWQHTEHLFASIRSLIDSGWIEVTSSSWAFSAGQRMPDVDEESIPLSDLLPPAEPEPERVVDTSTNPADPTTAAQIATLLAAAEAGVPFCEVCRREAAEDAPITPAPASRDDSVASTVAAQVATLRSAAETGAPFCEVCA